MEYPSCGAGAGVGSPLRGWCGDFAVLTCTSIYDAHPIPLGVTEPDACARCEPVNAFELKPRARSDSQGAGGFGV
jgi:hypothetical protein